MLAGGEIDGKRILSERIVKQMTSSYSCRNGTVMRGLGWDIASPFSSPKGRLFSEVSFGHTGYSGSSIWIDPKQDLFVIMLTNRLNYSDKRKFNQLRSDISTIAVAEFRKPGDNHGMTAVPEAAKIPVHYQPTAARITPSASRSIRMVAELSEVHAKAHRHYNKKNGKNHRRKSSGRTRRA
jgi:hypothetical protein